MSQGPAPLPGHRAALDWTPTFDKHPPQPDLDDHPLTWWLFLALRAACAAWHEEVGETAAMHLVGSALTTDQPRDLDIAVVMPVEEFEGRFGQRLEEFVALWGGPTRERHPAWDRYRLDLYVHLQDSIGWVKRTDPKPWPDCWFRDHPRLLLVPGQLA